MGRRRRMHGVQAGWEEDREKDYFRDERHQERRAEGRRAGRRRNRVIGAGNRSCLGLSLLLGRC